MVHSAVVGGGGLYKGGGVGSRVAGILISLASVARLSSRIYRQYGGHKVRK